MMCSGLIPQQGRGGIRRAEAEGTGRNRGHRTLELDSATVASWLQLGSAQGLHRIRVRPLSLGRLHSLISQKLGRSFPRPTMVRIAAIFAGNPFYALELARAMDGQSPGAEPVLLASLAELMRIRIGHLGAEDVRPLRSPCTALPFHARCVTTPRGDRR